MNQSSIGKGIYTNSPSIQNSTRLKKVPSVGFGQTQVEKSQLVGDDYNMRQQVKTVQDQAQATSYGFYIGAVSKFSNPIIPSIPRINH